ncbi:spore germination protein [Bacillus tequilensis]|uniref:spore germination protein n=1 Tax=Bacillus tequilensis TaxID=227866 RepID=UPI00157621B4|nr:spore germination protein [Bacillus tequilensis]NTU27886.1 spore germination protein [Bacillus tequilensis]
MMRCPVIIHSMSGNSVFNNGSALSISPFSVSKTTEGAGGGNTGMVFERTLSSQTNSSSNQALNQNIVSAIQKLMNQILT